MQGHTVIILWEYYAHSSIARLCIQRAFLSIYKAAAAAADDDAAAAAADDDDDDDDDNVVQAYTCSFV